MISKKMILAALAQVILLLIFCAPLTAFASVTWQEEDGEWKCYEKDGSMVRDRWKKGADGAYYYLDENGQMAADTLVEYNSHYYYVDSDGVRVTERWVCIPNEFGLWDKDVENIWYYFTAGGRAVRDGRKTIDGKKYLFDDEGRMLSGWQKWGGEEDLYYLGTDDEGWIHTGWQSLEPWYEMDGNYEEKEWFYFRPSSGKAYRDVKKRIDGDYYLFDENGVTKDRWNPTIAADAIASESSAEPAWFDEDTGKAWKGWIQAYDPEDVNETGNVYWYYLDSEGIPFNRGGKDAGSRPQKVLAYIDFFWVPQDGRYAAKVIGGKTYLFNEKGQMITGYMYLGNVPRKGGAYMGRESRMESYYFYNRETEKEGQMMTGKQTLYDDNGNDLGYLYLNNNGAAYRNFVADGRFYGPDGRRVDAVDDYRFLLINEGTFIKFKGSSQVLREGGIIVDHSGKVKKSGTFTIDGTRYRVQNYKASEEEAE